MLICYYEDEFTCKIKYVEQPLPWKKKPQHKTPTLSSATHKSTKPSPLQAIHRRLNQAGNLTHRGVKK